MFLYEAKGHICAKKTGFHAFAITNTTSFGHKYGIQPRKCKSVIGKHLTEHFDTRHANL